jgi:antitoxin FitA
MPVSFSIKNVPDEVAEKLRRRAVQRHRSLQGELLAILEESVAGERTLTPAELVRRLKTLGLETPSESAALVRKDRDADSRR